MHGHWLVPVVSVGALTVGPARMWSHPQVGHACPVKLLAEQEPSASLFPIWRIPLSGKRDLEELMNAFESTTTAVPLKASSEAGDGWHHWIDGGFATHRFINAKLSRTSYLSVLTMLLHMLVTIQSNYPDLYAVLKFVPKKNGLNPILAGLADGEDPERYRIDEKKPREVRRRLDDLGRTLSQSWLLLSCYLTLPGRKERDDFLWSARTVVEKVKTDQRSRALELLCLGFFGRGAAFYSLATARDLYDDRVSFTLKAGFEKNFGVDAWHPKPTNARMIWQRSRMVYPFLEMAHRAWLNQTGMALGQSDAEDCNVIYDYDALAGESVMPLMVGEDGSSAVDGTEYVPLCGDEADEENAAAIGELLDRIARASPEEKVLNSLLYWLIDLAYKVMLEGEDIKPWDPEPFILRRPGVEARMMNEVVRMGHLLQLLYRSTHVAAQRGDTLLLQVKEVETTTTLLSSIRSSCAESCPEVLLEYDQAMLDPALSLERLERLEFEALSALLGLPSATVMDNAETVRIAMREWRNPELLFRYLDDNRHDERMYGLILRWLRSIFGLSDETLRMIRRESPENVRHLLMIPQEVLLRWYSEACPGTSKCKTLFMVGEDAGSCLRIISNDGNKYNRGTLLSNALIVPIEPLRLLPTRTRPCSHSSNPLHPLRSHMFVLGSAYVPGACLYSSSHGLCTPIARACFGGHRCGRPCHVPVHHSSRTAIRYSDSRHLLRPDVFHRRLFPGAAAGPTRSGIHTRPCATSPLCCFGMLQRVFSLSEPYQFLWPSPALLRPSPSRSPPQSAVTAGAMPPRAHANSRSPRRLSAADAGRRGARGWVLQLPA